MKKTILMISGLIAWMALADDVAKREWSSVDGSSKIQANIVVVHAGKVVLKKENGRQITIPINKLCKEDQAYISEYVCEQTRIKKETETVLDLPYEQGKVVGPINAGLRSNYLLYLPKSLKNTRKAPLLFYSDAGGGNETVLSSIAEGAEINGWILAISVESRNDNTDDNEVICTKAIEHILDTLPVDEDRLYFCGNSGGGAQAFENAGSMDGCGIMPNIAYRPYHVSPPRGDCYILNGAWDYNRYAGARARKEAGKRAVHRLFPEGHGGAPRWLWLDGMAWLEGRYLVKHGGKHPEELMDYENSILDWIEQLKTTAPHRAYYWAIFLRDELEVSSGNQAAVAAVIEELGKDHTNVLFVEGLSAIDELSLEHMAKPKDPYHGIIDPDVVEACNELLEKYRGVPFIGETLEALCRKTD